MGYLTKVAFGLGLVGTIEKGHSRTGNEHEEDTTKT